MHEDRAVSPAGNPGLWKRAATCGVGASLLAFCGVMAWSWGVKWNYVVGSMAMTMSLVILVLTARFPFPAEDRWLRAAILCCPGMTLFFAGGSFLLWDAYSLFILKTVVGVASLLSFFAGYVFFVTRHRG